MAPMSFRSLAMALPIQYLTPIACLSRTAEAKAEAEKEKLQPITPLVSHYPLLTLSAAKVSTGFRAVPRGPSRVEWAVCKDGLGTALRGFLNYLNRSNMCDHLESHHFGTSDPHSDPCDRDHCHIYYVHQYGCVYRHPNVRFRDSVREVSRGKGVPKIQADAEIDGYVKKNGDDENQASTKIDRLEENTGNMNSEIAEAFCGDDRLTLM